MRWFFSLLFFLSSCSSPQEREKPRPVLVISAKKTPIEQARPFPGRTRAVNRANLSFRVSGPLVERPVFVGNEVKKGELLARLDPQDFLVKIEDVEGQLEQAKAELRFAESDYKRAERIQESDPGAISQSLVDRKLEDWNKRKGAVRSLEAQLDAAKNDLSYTQLRTPYDSTITATFVENFEYVQANQPIVRILDNRQIEMRIDVPETFISQIPHIKKIEVTFDTLPGKIFPASLKEIGTEATTTTRTYPITLLITQPENEEKIIPGMAGEARLYRQAELGEPEKAYLLPSTAIFTETNPEETYVWVVDPKTETVHKQHVVIEKMTSDGIAIKEGIQTDDLVVVVGVHRLKENQKVSLLPQQ